MPLSKTVGNQVCLYLDDGAVKQFGRKLGFFKAEKHVHESGAVKWQMFSVRDESIYVQSCMRFNPKLIVMNALQEISYNLGCQKRILESGFQGWYIRKEYEERQGIIDDIEHIKEALHNLEVLAIEKMNVKRAELDKIQFSVKSIRKTAEFPNAEEKTTITIINPDESYTSWVSLDWETWKLEKEALGMHHVMRQAIKVYPIEESKPPKYSEQASS